MEFLKFRFESKVEGIGSDRNVIHGGELINKMKNCMY